MRRCVAAAVAAHGGSTASSAHLQRLRARHELAVDVNLADLVLDDRDALAMATRQDVVEQRGLARPQEPGDDLWRARARCAGVCGFVCGCVRLRLLRTSVL
jgi:hypothetical protein